MEMYNDFRNLSSATQCANDAQGILEVQAVTLDSQEAVSRYATAIDDFTSDDFWGSTSNPSSCLINPNVLTSTNQKSYELSEQKKITHLNQLSKSLITTQSASNKNIRNLIYINGMLTPREQADLNMARIREALIEYNVNNVRLSLAYNFSGGAFIDGLQVLKQYFSMPNEKEGWFKAIYLLLKFQKGDIIDNAAFNVIANYMASTTIETIRSSVDYNLIKQHVFNKVTTGDTVILSHSQGNFFANEIWEEVNSYNAPKTSDFLRIHGLGTPASYIPQNFHYYTNNDDVIINIIRSIGPIDPLPSNIGIGTSGDKSGHGFRESYLKKGASHTATIFQRISTYFDDMESDIVEENPETSGICRNHSYSGSGNYFINFAPYIGKFKGTIRMVRNSFNAPNSYRLRDRFNSSVIHTGWESGTLHTEFYYDSAIHGGLSLEVTAETPWNDLWEVDFICPGML